MMPSWDGHLPDSGWEVIGFAMLLLFLAQAGAGLLIFRKHLTNDNDARRDREELKATTSAIKGQVVNGHAEPLRADLDTLREDISRLKADMTAWMQRWEPMIPVIASLREDFAGIRADLAEERSARRDLSREVREDMAANRAEVSDLQRRYGNGAR